MIGSLSLKSSNIKLALCVEAKAWKHALCQHMHKQFLTTMDDTFEQIDGFTKKLSRQIRDLDDVRFAMEALKFVREEYQAIDAIIPPIEEAFSLLNKFEFEVDQDEVNRCDSIRYAWKKCLNLSTKVQEDLDVIQPKFLDNLLEAVEVFKEDTASFDQDYAYNGPMVEGIKPAEASERLQVFQSRFDGLFRKFVTYSTGEDLFGL